RRAETVGGASVGHRRCGLVRLLGPRTLSFATGHLYAQPVRGSSGVLLPPLRRSAAQPIPRTVTSANWRLAMWRGGRPIQSGGQWLRFAPRMGCMTTATIRLTRAHRGRSSARVRPERPPARRIALPERYEPIDLGQLPP